MVGHQEPAAVLAEPDDGEADERCALQVEAAQPVGGHERVESGVPLLGGHVREVRLEPGQFHVAVHHLHRLAVLAAAEADAQVGVAAQQRGGRGPEPLQVQGPVEIHRDLHAVDVEGVLVVLRVLRVEEEPFLQGRQGQKILDT
ncbi:hypothetical protein M2436_003937 [Streptomyces sp. HB372]|nr:hypothetical protein [Streptomyces sp. HB372]